MAWKLRKDKLKAGAPEAAEQAPPEPASSTPAEETEQMPVFDLSGSAFRPEPGGADEEEPDVPRFLDDEPAVSLTTDVAHVEVPTPQSIELEPLATTLAPAETVPEPSFLPDPLPDFDPIVALPSDLEPASISIAPPTPSRGFEEGDQHSGGMADTMPEAELSAPGREAIAPDLVTLDTGTGLPKVAPFILDMPAVPDVTAAPRMHSVVIRIGKLSATHFLTKDVTTIGRPDSVVQNYPDIEIELDDGVSRRHAEIRHSGQEYTIEDVGSTNGTLLNGERLVPHQSMPLQPGDRIRVGEITELLFE